MKTWTWRHGDIDMETWNKKISNGKRKPTRFSLIRLLFAHCANGSLRFVLLMTKKQMEGFVLKTDYTAPFLQDSYYLYRSLNSP
jgi:hypothetical protein